MTGNAILDTMGARVVRRGDWGLESRLAIRALDALETGVLILSADRQQALLANRVARTVLPGATLPEPLADAIESYVLARETSRYAPPAIRFENAKRGYFLRVLANPGDPALEIVFIREEVVRDIDAFRLLNGRWGVSRREYQVLTALRLGKTNRQIATELGLAEGTIGRHVHRLLERLGAPNRTRLVDLVEQIIARRV